MKSQQSPSEFPQPGKTPEIQPAKAPDMPDMPFEEPEKDPGKDPDITRPEIDPEEPLTEPSPPEFPTPR